MSMSVALSLIEQKKKKNKFLLLFFSGIFLCALIFGVYIVFSANQDKKDIENYVSKSASDLATEINNETHGSINILNILANLIVDNPDLGSLENINTLFENTQKDKSFDRIVYLDTNGTGYTYDYTTKIMSSSDFSDNACFTKALSNKTCVNYDTSTNLTSMAVPAYSIIEKKVVGIFLGEKTLKPFDKIKNYFKSKYKTDIFIIDESGIIIDKKTEVNNFVNNSIFELPYQKLQQSNFLDTNNKVNLAWVDNNKTLIAVKNLEYDNNKLVIISTGFNNKNQPSITNIFRKLANMENVSIFIKIALYCMLGIICLVMLIYLLIKCYKQLSKKADKSVIKWAMHDDVTDGFNRSKFFLETSKELLTAKEGDSYALILMDIDNFKAVNQMYDTSKGNEVLKDISETIRWFLEKNGICARVMSDYFAVLYKYNREEKIINFINNITRAIGEYKLNLKLIPRFGIYKIDDFTMEVDEMLDRALMAKKKLDTESDTNYAFFTKDLIEQVQKARDIENEMYFALNQNQFVIYLQPQVDAFTKDVVGAEALVRWNHPQNGLETPDKFLPIFEKNAFITYLDQYVIEKVCKILSKWIAHGIEPLPIAINISNLDLSNPRFADMMKSMVDMYKVPAKFINFEISEAVAFENYKYIASTLADLKSFGFGLNLDNFGRTYTSANIFNIITFDNVKFNMKFIKNSIQTDKGRNILILLKSLVNSVYAKAIAVGIETDNELEFIKKAEFDYIQGFVHSRPMCVVDFEAFVFKRTIGSDEDICNG